MDRNIKAIPTEYNGTQYRSRTEARWAILFDLLGIEFEYERAKVQTGISNYIPDFILPESKTIFEVKGSEPTRVELERIAGLGIDSYWNTTRIITTGGPSSQLWAVYRWTPSVTCQEHYLSQCGYCGKFGFFSKEDTRHPTQMIPFEHYQECEEATKTGREFDIPRDLYGGYGNDEDKPQRFSPVSPMVEIAIKAATSISFDSKNFYEILDLHKSHLDVLKAHRVFCGSRFLHEMYRYIFSSRKDDGCPRFHSNGIEPEEGEEDQRFFIRRYTDLEKDTEARHLIEEGSGI